MYNNKICLSYDFIEITWGFLTFHVKHINISANTTNRTYMNMTLKLHFCDINKLPELMFSFVFSFW